MKELLSELNDEQLMSVITTDVPVRIIAGAGSGKTKVITTKVAYLIEQEKIRANKILCVTFTNKAANEMLSRISKIINLDNKPFITTFHSFGARVLREEYENCGLDAKFSIIDTNLLRQIIIKIFKTLNYDTEKGKRVTFAINKIGKWKNSFTSPAEAESTSNYGNDKQYSLIYRKYVEYLEQNNFVDFDDLILKVHTLLNENIEIREKWSKRYDYILVDEFQDTNETQYDIIKWLNGDKNSLTVVGDPDQTIYTWRGANVNLILDFDKRFQNSKTINLNRNYRSTKPILDLANDFIDNNKNRFKKNIFANKSGDTKPFLKNLATKNAETLFVINKIKELLSEGYKYSDIYILYRINSWSQEFEKELANANIPYDLVGGFKFLDRKVIQDINAMLKVISIKEPNSFERLMLLVPKVGKVTAQKIIDLAELESKNIVDFFMENHEKVQTITKNLNFLVNLINDTREMYEKNYDVQIIAEEMISKLEYFNLYDEKKPQDKEEIDYINSYLDQMRSFDEQFPKSEYKDMNKLDIFLQESNLDRNNDNKDIDNKVTLLTVHAAKGLENKIVFITGLSKGIFPSNLSSYKDELLEEERRAMYVAITRAEEKLFITYVSGEFSYVTNENLEPSMFINELNSNLIENSSTPIYINAPYIREEPKTINFKKSAELKDVLIGDKIEHVNFGLGMINKIVGRSMMVIFENPEYALKTVPINSSVWKKVV